MSPSAAQMLEKEIYPIIRNTIPRTARPMGSEDHEELVQGAVSARTMSRPPFYREALNNVLLFAEMP